MKCFHDLLRGSCTIKSFFLYDYSGLVQENSGMILIWIFWLILAQSWPIMSLVYAQVIWQWWLLSETYYEQKSWVSIFQNWPFGPDLAKVWPKFGPNYVHLTHFVTGVGSNNLIYALTVTKLHLLRTYSYSQDNIQNFFLNMNLIV